MPVVDIPKVMQMVSRSRHLIATLVARGVSAGGVIIVTLIVARSVSVEHAAQIFLFMAACSGLAILARFGTDLHVIRYVASNDGRDGHRHFLSSITVLLIASTVLTIMLWIGYAYFSFDGADKRIWYFLSVPLMALLINISHTASAWLKGLGKQVLGSVFEASGFYFFMIPVLLLTPVLTPEVFFAQAIAVCTVVSTVALLIALRETVTQRTKAGCGPITVNGVQAPWTTHMMECFPLALIAVLSFMSQWGMLFLVEHRNDAELLSELNILLRLLSPLVFLQLTLDSFLAPKFAAAKSAHELRRLRWLGILSIIGIAIPVSLPFWIFPDTVVTVLFGSRYSELAGHVPFAFLFMFLICCSGSNGMMLAVRQYRKQLLLFSAVRALLVISLTVILIPYYGVMGGLLAYLSGLCVQAILSRVYVDRVLRLMNTSPS